MDFREEKPRVFENEILRKFLNDLEPEKPAPPASTEKNTEEKPVPQPAMQEAPASAPASVPAPPARKSVSAKKRIARRPKVSEPAVPEAPFEVPEALFRRKGRVFSVINQKGGCGKTTTAINLAAGLAAEGFEVLLIDIDAQANATLGYGLRLAPEERTVYHLFREYGNGAAALIRRTKTPRVSLLPSSKFLASLASDMLQLKDWEYILRQALTGVKESFHYVVIDCPPALNALTVNALTASDETIIPLQTHYFSLEGMKELFLTIRSVQERLNPLLKSGLILPTLYDKRARINRDMMESIRNYFKDKVLDSVIHCNVKLVEAAMNGEPAVTFDPSSRGAQDYRALSREVIRKDEALFDGKPDDILAKFILQ